MSRDWQPIDTAPKDGTFVDVWADERRWPDLYWDTNSGAWASRRWKLGARGKPYQHNTIYTGMKPTHWMERPAPPGS